MNRLACLALFVCAAGAASAQTLTGVKIDPANAEAGAPVKISASFDNADNPNCNVRVHFGDGTNKDFKINQPKDVPLLTEHRYAKPGSYTVKVEPKTALPTLKCVGANQSTLLKVVAPVAAGAAKPAAPACPAGWKLDAKSVSKKSGAFTCSAKANTALPADKLACAAPLGYFENKSKGQLGCRP
jgi:PKD domain